MPTVSLNDYAHLAVSKSQNALVVAGHTTWQLAEAPHPTATQLMPAWERLHAAGIHNPPLSVVLIEHSPDLRFMATITPLITAIQGPARQAFLALLNQIGHDPRLQVHIYGKATDVAPPTFLRLVVALQLASCFWLRPDIIATVLNTHPQVEWSVDRAHYAQSGGIGGGCYVPGRHTIMLESSRSCEGFRTPTPSVSPLLHEMGHLLDATAQRLHGWRTPRGELPGMTTTQRTAWYHAKQHEVARYRRWCAQPDRVTDVPFGHPYVFQNDGEFVAGYWELFWRSPALMRTHAPLMYHVLCEYVQFDACRAQPVDYTGYFHDNQQTYATAQATWPSHMQWLNPD